MRKSHNALSIVAFFFWKRTDLIYANCERIEMESGLLL